MSEIELFKPKTGRDLRIQYPELYNIHEFKNLSAKEMLFVWYWSNPTSPVPFDMDHKHKIEFCIKESGWKPDPLIYRQLQENIWPDKMKLACDRMEKFEASIRNKARKVFKEIFANFEKLVKVQDSDFKLVDKEGNELGIDFAARNQYVTYAKNIATEMPGLIKKLEEGFGTDEGTGEVGSTDKAIDIWHKGKS